MNKGMRAYQDLRRANAAFTLEALAKDAKNFASLEKIHQTWWTKSSALIDELKVTGGGRFDTKLSKLFKGKNLSELQVRKILHHAGFKTYPRPAGIPQNCHIQLSERGGGMIYLKKGTTLNQYFHVRVMPGNPKAKYPSQRQPYVVQRRADKAVGIHRQLVERNSELAHIPIKEYQFGWW